MDKVEKEKNKKCLVLYYSFEGDTKMIATAIADSIKADVYPIEPTKEIPRGPAKYLWGGGQVFMNKKPNIHPLAVSLAQYDLIFLGTPVWAGTFAPPVATVLEKDIIVGKQVAFFCCHEGGEGKTKEKAEKAIEKKNKWLGAFSCVKVRKNSQREKDRAIQWAKEIFSQVNEDFSK